MKLGDIKSMKPAVEKLLDKNGWTVEKIATSTAPVLAKHRGIGLKLGGKLIEEARALVNQPRPELPGPIAPAPEQEIQMSPRVRRAVMSSDQGWNK